MASINLFNSVWYLQQNPDVAAAVQAGLYDAQTHYELFGRHEGRSPAPLFDPQDYLARNPDVAAAVADGLTTAYDHFIQFGIAEGRSPSALFNQALYLQQNPDVAAAVEAGLFNPVQHLLLYGASESRIVNPAIHLGRYMTANTDVQQVVANDVMSALDHLIMYGVHEGRDLGNGVSLAQFQNDPVFQQALSSGNALQALNRVNDVAPFIPTFQRPAGWAPAADTRIPTDFVPTATFKLVVPPEVNIPPGTDLRDTVFLIEQPGGGNPSPGTGIGSNPNTTSLTFSRNDNGNLGSDDFTDNPANLSIAVNDRFTVTDLTAFTPTAQISVPDTFSGWGDDIVHNNQFEVFYGTFDSATKIFTVTSTPTLPSLLTATHTLVLYDNDTSTAANIVDGLVVAGVYAEQQWYVGGDPGSRFLAYDALLEQFPSYASYANALYGTDASDTINGLAGGDIIVGGGGADTLTGGAGADAFVFARADSVLSAMDTITDYRAGSGDNNGAPDIIRFTDLTVVASQQNATVLDLTSASTLQEAIDNVASLNMTDEGLSVFLHGSNTYFYVEQAGSGSGYVATDWLVEITGTPFAAGTAIDTLGVEGINPV